MYVLCTDRGSVNGTIESVLLGIAVGIEVLFGMFEVWQ
jgi:hypothetical protein